MKTIDPTKGLVAILGAEDPESAAICRTIQEGQMQTKICSSLDQLKQALAEGCLAAILDIDQVPLDNRAIRALALAHPGTSFFCTSSQRFHPDLQNAISHHLFACLHKPVDPDELHYFLKCILDEGVAARGSPDVRA